jgi:hypothetical protein
MKNKLTLFMLLSLFAGVALHASDAYKQEMDALIKKTLPEAEGWSFPSIAIPSDIHIVFKPKTLNLPTCMHKPVFTYENVDYMLTKIDTDAIVNFKGEKIYGLIVVTLIPKVQRQE